MTQQELRNDAHSKWLYGQWLAQEVARHELPVVQPRPRETLVQRLVKGGAKMYQSGGANPYHSIYI